MAVDDPILNYSLISGDAVEISTSSDPDDISRATIQISARGTLNQTERIDRITITIPLELTPRPDNITAESSQFGGWGLFKMGGGVFEARAASASGGATVDVTFILRDVEIATAIGQAVIQVKEFPGGGTKDLPIRKVSAALRIEEFKADEYSVTKSSAVTLSWVTVGASEVRLSGPGIPADADGGALKVEHAGSRPPVSPSSSAVYTLTAKAGEAIRSQQVHIAVTDQFKLDNGAIDIGTGRVSAGSVDVGAGSVNAGSVNLGSGSLNAGGADLGAGELKAGKITAIEFGEVHATNFIGNGAVPRGVIVLWSGHFHDIPSGWALCDGNNGTPNLKGKFVLGARSDTLAEQLEDTNANVGGVLGLINLSGEPPSTAGTTLIRGTQESGTAVAFQALQDRRIRILNGPDGPKLTQYNFVPYFTLAYIQKL